MTASRSVASEINGARSSAGGGRASPFAIELVPGARPREMWPVERALTRRDGLSLAIIGLFPRCGNVQAATELGGQVPP